jgi:heme/copper-type cytochrome/quinol oxidase subunit 1
MRRLNMAQRIVVIVGLGFVLLLLGSWLTSLGTHPLSGWTGYAPLNESDIPSVGGLPLGCDSYSG